MAKVKLTPKTAPAKASTLRRAAAAPRARGGLLTFFRETWSELKKVTWPTWEQARNLSVIVILVSAAVGLFLGGIDAIFNFIITQVILP